MARNVRRLARFGAALAGAVVSIAPLSPALAEVEVETVAPRGDGSVDLVLSVAGGCEAGTTGLAATLPAGASVVTVAEPGGWSHEIEGREVSWAGPALAGAASGRFTVTARLDVVPGDTVVLPTVQTCADGGELGWSEADPAGGGQAPTFTATASMVDPTARAVPEAAVPSVAGGWTVAVVVAGLPLTVALALGLRARRARSPRGVSSARA
jgi:uncharacterized protein YcnI